MKKGIFKKITAFLFAAMFIFLSCGNIVFAADNVSLKEETENVVGSVEPLAANSPIENGYYVLKNPHTGRFVDVDNDGKTPNGDKLEQWDYDGEPTQVWIFSRIPSGTYAGYYNILQSQSMLYMTVKDNSDKNDADVILSNYVSGSSGQAWKIEYANNGQYKITPACGEAAGRVLCVNNSIFGANVNGLDIKSRTYSNDSNYKDEWLLYSYRFLNLDSRYDNGFASVFGNNSQIKIKLSEGFFKQAVEKSLPIGLNVSTNVKNVPSRADAHSGSCTSSCGGDCRNHHKNYIGMSNDIWYNETILPNTVYISWTERPYYELCSHFSEKHTTNTMAAVVRDRVGFTENYVSRPIIGVFHTNDGPDQTVCSVLTLCHEFAHVLEMPDIYDSDLDHIDGRPFKCVMMRYSALEAQNLYDSIFVKNGSPYCDSCLKKIWDNTQTPLNFNGK